MMAKRTRDVEEPCKWCADCARMRGFIIQMRASNMIAERMAADLTGLKPYEVRAHVDLMLTRPAGHA